VLLLIGGITWVSSNRAVAAGNGLTVTRIADTNTVIPAGTFAGQRFSAFTSSGIVTPPVLDQGFVEFMGAPSGTSLNGVYTSSSDGPPLQLLADSSVNRPGSSTPFSSFRYPSTHGGQFSFSSYDGIYTTVGGTLTSVIGPGSGFSGSSAPANDGHNVWFFGDDPADGIFRWSAGGVAEVVAKGQATPGQTGYAFTALDSNVAAANGTVAFFGGSQTTPGSVELQGVYTESAANGVQRIADSTMSAPGTTGTFNGFANFPFAFDGRSLVFTASTARGLQIDLARDDLLQALVINGQSDGSGATIQVSEFGDENYCLDGDNIAMLLDTSARTAVYTESIGVGPLTRVVGVGDPLFGSTITSISMSDEALSNGQLAVYASLANGTRGVYVVSVPEPATVAVALCAAAVGFMTRRRPVGATPALAAAFAIIGLAGWPACATTLSQPRDFLAAAAAGNQVLFGGGLTSIAGHDAPSAVVDIYNTSTQTMSTATLSAARRELAAGSADDEVLFAGGLAVNGRSAAVDLYNVTSHTWSTAALSQARMDLAAASLGDQILFAGGNANTGTSSVVDIFNALTGAWTTASLSVPRTELAAAAAGDKAVFAGGWNNGTYSNVVDIYDASTNAWSTAHLSVGRSDLSAAAIGNLIFFAGGSPNGFDGSSVVDIYDTSTNHWSTAKLSQGRYGLAAAATNGTAYFAGGQIGGDEFSSLDAYDQLNDSWTASSLPTSLTRLAATSLGNSVFLGGGATGTGYSNAFITLTPVPEPSLIGALTFVVFVCAGSCSAAVRNHRVRERRPVLVPI
jgi:hypothetical protein